MKIGRNNHCPCGSGKKYKKCCEIKHSTGHHVGQKYIEDTESVDVIIKYSVRIPVVFDNFNIDINNLHIRQGNGVLYVNWILTSNATNM